MESNPALFAVEAEKLLENGNFSDALSLCEDGINKYADYASGYIIAIKASFKLNDLDKAENLLKRANKKFRKNKAIQSLADELAQLRDIASQIIEEIPQEPEEIIEDEPIPSVSEERAEEIAENITEEVPNIIEDVEIPQVMEQDTFDIDNMDINSIQEETPEEISEEIHNVIEDIEIPQVMEQDTFDINNIDIDSIDINSIQEETPEEISEEIHNVIEDVEIPQVMEQDTFDIDNMDINSIQEETPEEISEEIHNVIEDIEIPQVMEQDTFDINNIDIDSIYIDSIQEETTEEIIEEDPIETVSEELIDDLTEETADPAERNEDFVRNLSLKLNLAAQNAEIETREDELIQQAEKYNFAEDTYEDELGEIGEETLEDIPYLEETINIEIPEHYAIYKDMKGFANKLVSQNTNPNRKFKAENLATLPGLDNSPINQFSNFAQLKYHYKELPNPPQFPIDTPIDLKELSNDFGFDIAKISNISPKFSDNTMIDNKLIDNRSEYGEANQDSNTEIVTDTIANILMLQGAFAQAAEAYKELSKKYPDKEDFYNNKITEALEKANK